MIYNATATLTRGRKVLKKETYSFQAKKHRAHYVAEDMARHTFDLVPSRKPEDNERLSIALAGGITVKGIRDHRRQEHVLTGKVLTPLRNLLENLGLLGGVARMR